MAESNMKSGAFCWNELATRDVEGATKFYCDLLGWTASVDNSVGSPYTIFKKGETMVAGMMGMTEEYGDTPPHWMGYILVDDVDHAAKKTEELGGKVCVPPMDIPSVGRFTVITDPTGATISLIKFSTPSE